LAISSISNASSLDLADEIISKYANIDSYEDIGSSIVKMVSAEGSTSVTNIEFETKFSPNGDMRFTWKESPANPEKIESWMDPKLKEFIESMNSQKTYTFWREGEEVYSKYDDRPSEKEESICSAYAGATGISNGIAANVPRYLVAEECYDYPHMIFPNLKVLRSSGKEKVAEITYHTGNKEKLFFSVKTGLLARTKESYVLKSGTVVSQETKYKVKQLKFKPNK
jgi:hypothetical protein